MRKINITLIITAIIIIVGIFANGIILRNKFLKGEFDDPFKNGTKQELHGITSLDLTNYQSKYQNKYYGEIKIKFNDSINEIMSQSKEDISTIVEDSLLTVMKVLYGITEIKISDLKHLRASKYQNIFIDDFTITNLDISASDSTTITLNNCKIENLNIIADNHTIIVLESTNLIQNVNLILTSNSTFSALDINFKEFVYDIEDDCSLNLSGKSLKMLK
ncbi:DUF2807 domain-containing protein [Odoribacter sp. OttesenSCG-928-L07]|nr:DUF2807 domain-containing protein [Odoribacter sp. OttesenSCG-928-L07]MDL2239511.1 DUF2807 domain-containing protein [Bacteroidales bacterium OttesenSCG-928-L14]